MPKNAGSIPLRAEIEDLGVDIDEIADRIEQMIEDSERGRPVDWILLGDMLREAGRMRDRLVDLLDSAADDSPPSRLN